MHVRPLLPRDMICICGTCSWSARARRRWGCNRCANWGTTRSVPSEGGGCGQALLRESTGGVPRPGGCGSRLKPMPLSPRCQNRVQAEFRALPTGFELLFCAILDNDPVSINTGVTHHTEPRVTTKNTSDVLHRTCPAMPDNDASPPRERAVPTKGNPIPGPAYSAGPGAVCRPTTVSMRYGTEV